MIMMSQLEPELCMSLELPHNDVVHTWLALTGDSCT